MILLLIFILGCFVMSLVATGLLFALAAVGYGDEYTSEKSTVATPMPDPPPKILRPEPTRLEAQK